ncbi:DUF456 domain-containing protein [Puniceicoccaceae bacterium K14]|nr:DUF456 domain-containing protein [Puniceicoccaceae bacterium K14]
MGVESLSACRNLGLVAYKDKSIESNESAMWDWLNVVGEWFVAMAPYLWGTVAWTLLAVGILGGIAGVFLPVVPGAIVLWLGALAHKLILPDWLSWWGTGILFAMVIVDRVVDFAGTALGTKWFGGSKWAIIGAMVGGLVGIFFGIFGLILGPVAGAFIFEWIAAKESFEKSARSGVGAGVGFGISTVGRLVVWGVMVVVVAIDVIFV